jgi:hypothetical protein
MTRGPGQSEEEEVLTRGVLLSAGERGRGDTPSGLAPGRPWAVSASGPERCPAAFFPFSTSFSFSVFCFLILDLFQFLLQTCFKSNQTNS